MSELLHFVKIVNTAGQDDAITVCIVKCQAMNKFGIQTRCLMINSFEQQLNWSAMSSFIFFCIVFMHFATSHLQYTFW